MEIISLLAIYFAIILVILGFLVVFFLHIKNYKHYAPHIIPAFKIFLILIIICVIFGTSWIIFGESFKFAESDFDLKTNTRMDF